MRPLYTVVYQFNRSTTGRIPADEGAELDEPGDEPNFDLFGSFGLF